MAKKTDEGRLREHESSGDPRQSDVTSLGRGGSDEQDVDRRRSARSAGGHGSRSHEGIARLREAVEAPERQPAPPDSGSGRKK